MSHTNIYTYTNGSRLHYFQNNWKYGKLNSEHIQNSIDSYNVSIDRNYIYTFSSLIFDKHFPSVYATHKSTQQNFNLNFDLWFFHSIFNLFISNWYFRYRMCTHFFLYRELLIQVQTDVVVQGARVLSQLIWVVSKIDSVGMEFITNKFMFISEIKTRKIGYLCVYANQSDYIIINLGIFFLLNFENTEKESWTHRT